MIPVPRIVLTLLSLAIFLSPSLPATAQETAEAANPYLDQLIERAKREKMAESAAWLKLIHYQPLWLGRGHKSIVDAKEFFLAPEGKSNPEAELLETLRGFFSTEENGPEKQTIQCAFPARFALLDSMLHFDLVRLPRQSCPRFEEWRRALDVEGVTLVYPAAYLNNPASMFGHTLLRLDAKGQTETTRLLAYGASYAAATNESSGLFFAFRAIAGLYRGVFSVSPYYKQVHEYNDIENRDIWEYQLNFSGEELDQIVRHLWELGSTWFVYYFFDENCSYQLLALLEAAVPRLEVAQGFPLWVIPPETVRAAVMEPGLVRQSTYRASKSTLVHAEEAALPKASRILAGQLARGEASIQDIPATLSPEERARVLELAYDFLEYLQDSGKGVNGDAAQRGRELLEARRAVGRSVPAFKVKPPPVRPDEGHRSGFLGLGGGTGRDGPFETLEVRPAFHDLLDPEPGYVRGAELRFGDLKLQNSADKGFQLSKLTPLAIQSLSPRTELFRPTSWKAGIELERRDVESSSREPLVTTGTVGAGRTYELNSSTLVYGLFTGSLRLSRHLAENIEAGAGPELGGIFDVAEDLRLKADAALTPFSQNSGEPEYRLSVAAALKLSDRTAIRGEFAQGSSGGRSGTRVEGAFIIYF